MEGDYTHNPVSECNGDAFNGYPFVKFSKGKNKAAICWDYFPFADNPGLLRLLTAPSRQAVGRKA
jgi:hypothetical protein